MCRISRHAGSEGADPARRSLFDRRICRPGAIRSCRAVGAIEAGARRRAVARRAGRGRVQERLSAALKFDYSFKANEAPFDIQSIYHDDKFTYIKTTAPEKFSVYEMKDGKPNLITYDLRDGTYIIPKVMDSGYVELGKKRMDFSRKG